MTVRTTMLGLCAPFLFVATMAWGQQIPPLPQETVACEQRLAVWQQNGQAFITQIMELEAMTRDLRQKLATVTKDRDELRAKHPTPASGVQEK